MNCRQDELNAFRYLRGHDQGREGGDRALMEETRHEQRPSDLDGGAADAAGLELPAPKKKITTGV